MATQNHATELSSANCKPLRSRQQIADEASKEFDDVSLTELTDELIAAMCRDLD
jgi:hypothetical protein